MHLCQEMPSNDVTAKTDISNGSSSELTPSDSVPYVQSLPAIGQICGLHKDGRLDVLWVDGTRSTTYLHHLYVVADEVLLCLHTCEKL